MQVNGQRIGQRKELLKFFCSGIAMRQSNPNLSVAHLRPLDTLKSEEVPSTWLGGSDYLKGKHMASTQSDDDGEFPFSIIFFCSQYLKLKAGYAKYFEGGRI